SDLPAIPLGKDRLAPSGNVRVMSLMRSSSHSLPTKQVRWTSSRGPRNSPRASELVPPRVPPCQDGAALAIWLPDCLTAANAGAMTQLDGPRREARGGKAQRSGGAFADLQPLASCPKHHPPSEPGSKATRSGKEAAALSFWMLAAASGVQIERGD